MTCRAIGGIKRGATAIVNDEQYRVRQYILGQLEEVDEEKVELRLLTDADFLEEFEIIEDELIDLYLDGALSPEERTQFERHRLNTPEQRDKLSFAAALKNAAQAQANKSRAAPPAPQQVKADAWRLLSPVYMKAAAVVIITLGLGLGGWLLFVRRPAEDQDLAALNSAYKNRRLIEARIVGMDYAPLVVTRGTERSSADEDALRREELRLLNKLNDHPGAEAQHALGRFYLAGRQFDKAVEHLEKAAEQKPNNAQIHSDLGAALFELGDFGAGADAGGGLKYSARSLNELDRALELDGSLPEALYNRAIVRQRLMMTQQAEDDWRKYLERDHDSPWAEEARKNLKLLEEKRTKSALRQTHNVADILSAYQSADDDAAWKIYTRCHTSSGNAISSALVDSYLDLQAGGNKDEALRSIRVLAYLGNLEAARVGDHYTAELARFYSSTDSRQRAILTRARGLVRKADELAAKTEFAEAIGSLTDAKRAFEQAGDSAEAVFADYAVAHCYAVQPDIERGLSIFTRLTPTCEGRGFKWLLAQCLRVMAHLQLNRNDYSEAIRSGTRALGISEQVQDSDGQMRSLTQVADMYQSLNNNEKSLDYLLRGLLVTQDYDPDPKQVWGLYIASAFNFNALGYYRVALDYQREALTIALGTGIPLIISRSYEYLGMTYGNLKLYDEAVRAVEMAYQQGEYLNGERAGLNMMANSSLKLGDLYRTAGNQTGAIEAYDRSIALYDRLAFYHYSYLAHKGKLLSYLALGNDASSSEELQKVLGLFEQYRVKINEERQRDSFFDNEQSVYDIAIDFESSRMGDPRRAFEYSELSKARSLLDLMRNGGQVVEVEHGLDLRAPKGSVPLSLTEIQERMPENAQILQYAVLDGKLLIWLLSKTDFSYKSVDVDSKALSDKVAAFLRSVTNPDAGDGPAGARELHEILIKPLEERINPEKLLCIVPDKELNFVPFGALISGRSGKYVAEEYRLTLSPSSTIFDESSAAARKRELSTTDEILLAVGDPSFDRDAFPQLPRMPSSAREAEKIAAYYKTARVLPGEQAVAREVKAAMKKADVVHLAAHYVVDQEASLRSKLVLAKSAGGGAQDGQPDGTLESWEIYQMGLPQTRLVVLSGCQTGIERQYKGEGAISFARPFIAAGIPLVVASLWSVDSDASEELMVNFHRYRKRESLPTAEALRRVQLDMIEGREGPLYRHPYYWAAFVVIGGYTEF